MEALLGAGQSNPSCGSIGDLQVQLRDLLSSRVTETRADHISVTTEIRATAVFDIPVTDTENEAFENWSSIDPLLGGARSSVAPPAVNGNGGPPSRRVNAIDTLINQPLDDPVLQTSVTGHIIASLGKVDGSIWTVRQISRNEQGWTFTYICKDSWQAWSRQVSKNPAKTAIGEWSDKSGQDPIHMGRFFSATRPAFDCRGFVKVAFVKSTKTIDVRYEHTPMHKTVAQLIELLAPPPVAPMVKTSMKKPREPRPPKEPKAPKELKPKTPKSLKNRAGENMVVDGDNSQPKKKRKKKDSLALAVMAGTVLPPEMPGALPVGDASARQLYNTQTGAAGGAQPGGSSGYPDGLVNATGDEVAPSTNSDAHPHSILNLPAGEAARRRDFAIKLLTDSNIDPKTLSPEQFNIFANQSLELQQDSLAMLIKYGAERLRIVHPSKEGSNSGQSTPTKNTAPGPPGGTPQSAKPKKPRKQKAEVKGAGIGEAPSPEAEEVKQRRRICENCLIKKYKGKCDKARPSCSVCLEEGVACVYAPSRPRQSKVAEAEAVPVSTAPEQANAQMPNEEPDDLGSPGFHTETAEQPILEPVQIQEQFHAHEHQTANAPVSETTALEAETPSAVFNQTHGIYQHPFGLSFPQAAETLVHGYSYLVPPTSTEQSSIAAESGQRGSSGGQPSTSRRSLPAGQSSHATGVSDTTMGAQNSWQTMSANPTQATSATRISPGQSRAKKPVPVSQAYDDVRQQQASSCTSASQSVSQASQPPRGSPSQTAAQPARATSRQGNRGQSHPPVNSVSAAPQVQSEGTQPIADNNTEYTPNAAAQESGSAQSYSQYSQYQGGNTQADSSSDRLAYQPYSSNQIATQTQPTSYSSFDNYNTRLPNTATPSLATPGTQNIASSYPANSGAASDRAQWGSSTATAQARNTQAYNAMQPASGTGYNTSSNAPQSQSLQGLSVTPQPPTARSSPTAFSQQLQQQQHQQHQQHQQEHKQQHQQQGQNHQQPSYNGYMSQPAQQDNSSTQQTWGYGFGTGSNPSSGYGSTAGTSASNAYPSSATASHGHGHQAHQTQAHRPMNLSSHTYSSMDHDQALYDLLRNSQTG
ncbi:hypothetical protein N657DRAFT_670298 [Parathielavia appendiculata]|uniref:Uncharacterized protein n=1 Tax=Parathielavia appendiculata TaxID=2587402 RepID=A0AAN6U578_9PEZI|nr:hypothetical protein N657DRAFT_670298 [Parathielavia appendiculata]